MKRVLSPKKLRGIQLVVWSVLFVSILVILIVHVFLTNLVNVEYVTIGLILVLVFLSFAPAVVRIDVSSDGVGFELEQLESVDLDPFRKQMQELVSEIETDSGEETISKASEKADEETSELSSQLNSLVKDSPNQALVRLRIELEKVLNQVFRTENIDIPENVGIGQMVNIARENEILDDEIVRGIMYISQVCNKAVHGTNVSTREAEGVINIGVDIIETLYEYEILSETLEKDLIDRMIDNPEAIEEGLTIERAEKRIGKKRIDLVALDSEQTPVLIEVPLVQFVLKK